ncbi:hypothetical protein OsJ_35899 [Oryza sativa Japonica Group]|uniref:Reverse transcriptase domain-containing protein n=1 Tax=Oryza sativa subsp. japonica TaxID=39947 RepID=B9GCW0_ORYSJ|nr:hypothetical protein OsJ_35899 [Oryza sativa Japonica Group]
MFDNNIDLSRVNQSYITLLPKTAKAVQIKDSRPISLLHSVPKLLSKTLTNRLQMEIIKLIDPMQSGFIKNICIHENFILVLEMVQSALKKKKPIIVLKLDFHKAFDTVRWDALFNVLGEKLRLIIINREKGEQILYRRGVCQGDPLSPYLFIPVADVLQKMIQRAYSTVVLIHPLDIEGESPTQQYADDTLILIKGDADQATTLKEILDSFASFSGLQINYHKSTLVPIHLNDLTKELLHPNHSYQAESELETLLHILQDITPIPEVTDTRELLYPAPKISTANAYHLLTYHGSLWKLADYIWLNTIPLNCKIFLWLAFKDRLNTKANMVKKNWDDNPHCNICPALESADHILLRCKNANNLWKKLDLLQLANKSKSAPTFIQAVMDRNHSTSGIEPIWFAACAYKLWKSRNNRIFEGQIDHLQYITQQIADILELWNHRANERTRQNILVFKAFLGYSPVYIPL